MTTRIDLRSQHLPAAQQLVELVRAAIEVASTPDELLDVARAARALDDPALLHLLADRIGREAQQLALNIETWPMTMEHNRLDGWRTTGHRASVLAEAWGVLELGGSSTP